MRLAIVSTLYRSESFIEEFCARVSAEAEKFTNDYEIILVNDGSPDASLDRALKLSRTNSHLTIVDLSRNFGHHKAIMTGLHHVSSADFIFLLDSDLEEEPELLSVFFKALNQNPNADVVYGVQETRKGSWFEQVSGAMYYKIINALWEIKIPENLIVARLMSKRYVENLLKFSEHELVISGIWTSTGFVQIPVIVTKHSREGTTYSFAKKFWLTIGSITAFSSKPLIYIAALGLGIMLIGFALIAYLVWIYFSSGKVPNGFTSILASIWLLGGIITFSIGVVAIYLSIVFVEVKQRPYTIVKEVYRGNDKSTP